jgi:ribosome-associated translation inhibitor RaiA
MVPCPLLARFYEHGHELLFKDFMKVTLHAAALSAGGANMKDHVHASLSAAMARFGDRVTTVHACLADANSSAKPGADSTNCTLEANLAHLEAVVVKEKAVNAHTALAGAVRKLKRAVGASVAKHDPRHGVARHARQAALEAKDPVGKQLNDLARSDFSPENAR